MSRCRSPACPCPGPCTLACQSDPRILGSSARFPATDLLCIIHHTSIPHLTSSRCHVATLQPASCPQPTASPISPFSSTFVLPSAGACAHVHRLHNWIHAHGSMQCLHRAELGARAASRSALTHIRSTYNPDGEPVATCFDCWNDAWNDAWNDSSPSHASGSSTHLRDDSTSRCKLVRHGAGPPSCSVCHPRVSLTVPAVNALHVTCLRPAQRHSGTDSIDHLELSQPPQLTLPRGHRYRSSHRSVTLP